MAGIGDKVINKKGKCPGPHRLYNLARKIQVGNSMRVNRESAK